MSQKKTEINVNDLLDQLDNNKRTTKDTTQSKQKKADDWDHDEDQYVFTVSKNDQASGKPKTSKKKVQVKGWGDYEAEHNEPKEEAPAKDDSTEVAEPKKKMFKKPTGETKPTVDVKVSEEYFPSLGEEAPKNMPKKEPEQQPQPVQTTTGLGPRRFVNAKKEGQGEHFAPIEIKEKEPPQPQPTIQRTHQPLIQRATEKPQEKQEEAPVEGKIKFGGEGPRRFVGAKAHKEEQKSEADLLREQKEREVEEKLRKEKEELAKEIEARKARKAFGDKKPEESKDRPHKGDDHHHDKPHHDKPQTDKPHEKSEHENGEHKKKFTNAKKAHHEEHEKPKQKEEEPQTEEAVKQETKEVVTSASQKGWGEGGIVKKPIKKI